MIQIRYFINTKLNKLANTVKIIADSVVLLTKRRKKYFLNDKEICLDYIKSNTIIIDDIPKDKKQQEKALQKVMSRYGVDTN